MAVSLILLLGTFTAVANNNFLLTYGLPLFELAAAAVVLGAVTLMAGLHQG